MRLAGNARPEAISAERTRSRDSATALSPRPTTVKATAPPAICTWTSTGRASTPSKATVDTRETISAPRLGLVAGRNICRTSARAQEGSSILVRWRAADRRRFATEESARRPISSKKTHEKPQKAFGFALTSLSESSLFKGLRRPLGPQFIKPPQRPLGRRRAPPPRRPRAPRAPLQPWPPPSPRRRPDWRRPG